MIISHHGQLEFGSPKLPQFPEALLFHYLDDMDSKMECIRALLERDQTPGNFTSFSHALERVMLKQGAFLMPRRRQSRAPGSATPAPLHAPSRSLPPRPCAIPASSPSPRVGAPSLRRAQAGRSAPSKPDSPFGARAA